MKKSMFRWFFVAIFCLTFSAGVQASFLNDFKAKKINIEEAIQKGKALGIPLADVIRLLTAFSPPNINIVDIVKVAIKGESAAAAQTIIITAIGTLIGGSGIGAIKDENVISVIAKIITAVKEANPAVAEIAKETAEAIKKSGIANAAGNTAST